MVQTTRLAAASRWALLVVVLSGCSTSVPASRTPAANGECVGACLSGADPYDARCAEDATTIASADVVDDAGKVVAKIDLRWSAHCEASWARATRVAGARGALVATIDAAGRRETFEHASDGEVWTDMVPDRACATATAALRREDRKVFESRAARCATARSERRDDTSRAAHAER